MRPLISFATRDQSHRVAGLDTLRFFAALWVVFSHCGSFPLTEGIDKSHLVGLLIKGVYGNLFPGPPAVMVFFVISGFCIHFPYRSPGSFNLATYLARRYIRIGIPIVVAIYLARPLQVNLHFFQNSILWTLVAELIYYTIYPILRLVQTRVGWNKLILLSFGGALAALLVHPTAADYSPFGNSLCWLLGLPCWLLGCKMAELSIVEERASVSRGQIWVWRIGIWFLACVASMLRFHSPIGYPWTLLVFSVPAFYWLQKERLYFRGHGVVRAFEWAGQWSYSIYLIHLIAAAAFVYVPTVKLGFILDWAIKIGWILVLSYVFFLLVENPSHLTARWVSKKLRKAEKPK